MHVTPNMYKNVTLTWQMPRKLSPENAFDTKYVQNRYFEGKCSGNHYCENAFDTKYVQNCYFEGKC